MNTLTPTPRTDAAWSSSFDGKQLSAGQTARALRECSQKLETELTALRADLAALEQCHDDNCRAVVKLDAELATERARLDAGTILLTVAGERVWHCGVDLRAAIDAAMKEAAK